MRALTESDFQWTCSYMNETEYKWFGGTIDVYRYADAGLMEYMRSIFNHASPGTFENEVIARMGGACIHRKDYRAETYRRWTPEIWGAFCAHLTRRHDEGQSHTRQFAAQNPEVDFSDLIHDLVLPRPIYWDSECGAYQIEPWYQAEAIAA